MKRIIIFCIVIITVISCKKLLDENIDPATPQQVPAHTLLAPMFTNMERGIAGDTRYIGRYVQHFGLYTTNDAWERHGYVANSDAAGEIWRAVYFGIGKNINLMIDDANKGQKWEFIGAGLAIRAWGWQTATDYHGEIIVKQAFEPNRVKFEYDKQDTVYAEVVRVCNEALEYFNRTDGKLGAASLFPTGDVVYKGDVAKWRKFINGILARNASNLSNKPSYNADQVISFVDNAMASNADNFIVPHPASPNSDNSNHFGPAKIPSSYPSLSGSYIQSNMIARLMNGDVFNGVVDPRAPFMLTASLDGQYRGSKPGQGDPNRSGTVATQTEIPNIYGIRSATTPTAGTGKFIFKDDAGFPVMTYAEMQFIKAEAAFRKGSKDLAYTAFKNGIGAHMDWVGVLAANKATYLASAAVPQTSAALTLKDIMLQKYISLWAFGGLETWVDMRRYHYDTTVYSRYTILPDPTYSTGTLFSDNNGKLAYRVRPRYNSEYVWNLDALIPLEGDKPYYHTLETWFSKP
jgi:hypothetical protein